MKSLKQRQLENQKRKQQREDAEREKTNGVSEEQNKKTSE